MCRPSPISDDWIIKGFHLHVDDIELAVRPGHASGLIVFASVFSRVDARLVDAAVSLVQTKCVQNPSVRRQWCTTIDRAIGYLDGCTGELADLANGRKAELTFLKHALLVYDSE